MLTVLMLPTKNISVVIPVRPGGFPTAAIDCLRRINYPLEKLEVLVCEGTQPSRQRNAAVAQSSADIIYFLDDDSFVSPEVLQTGLPYLDLPDVAAAGGPAVTHQGATLLEACAGEVISSVFGTFLTRARNIPLGEVRQVRGEELILCNLLMKKNVFLAENGLNPELYPNEENELLKRMRCNGHRFYYVPQMLVWRTRRKSLAAISRQYFHYGFGRGRHIFSGFTFRDFAFFAPPLFVLYLISLIFFHPLWYTTPLALYLLTACGSSVIIMRRSRSAITACCALALFPLVHASYGAGFIFGITSRIRQKQQEKPIRIIKVELTEEAPAVAYA